MPVTKADKIRSESLIELKTLAGWFDLKYGTTIIILGGWAVYSYNPYQGSFDIDCIGPREPFYGQLEMYMSLHGYVLEPKDQLGFSKFYVKHIYEQEEHIGDLHIDACSFKDENPFKENSERKIPYGLCAKSEYLTKRPINDTYVWVPSKELLFLYKLKALRDRTWILSHEPLQPEDRIFIQGKITKDKTDLLALLDPKHGPLDSNRLYSLIRDFSLEFIITTLRDLSNQQDAIANYRTTRADAESWISKILHDIGISV